MLSSSKTNPCPLYIDPNFQINLHLPSPVELDIVEAKLTNILKSIAIKNDDRRFTRKSFGHWCFDDDGAIFGLFHKRNEKNTYVFTVYLRGHPFQCAFSLAKLFRKIYFHSSLRDEWIIPPKNIFGEYRENWKEELKSAESAAKYHTSCSHCSNILFASSL